jgi:hypothetical protein
MATHVTAVDETIAQAAADFVDKIAPLGENHFLREGIVKAAIQEMTWALFYEFNAPEAMAEHFELMSELVRDKEVQSTKREEINSLAKD